MVKFKHPDKPFKADEWGNVLSQRKDQRAWTLDKEVKAKILKMADTHTIKYIAIECGVSEGTVRYYKNPVECKARTEKWRQKNIAKNLAKMRVYSRRRYAEKRGVV